MRKYLARFAYARPPSAAYSWLDTWLSAATIRSCQWPAIDTGAYSIVKPQVEMQYFPIARYRAHTRYRAAGIADVYHNSGYNTGILTGICHIGPI